ncbi:zeta toxin family protein [Nocardiopsis sp. M1B1]|uniref:zeta toxin family protein n=1 Tax=Nocardiopsis sp. M1B1 TaxID=3450454 RepID=UPI004039F72D
MAFEEYELSREQLDHIFDRPRRGVRKFVFGGYAPTPDSPVLVLVGGQTGAGKSRAVADIMERHKGIVPIIGDELRAFHPRYREVMRTENLAMPDATAQASGEFLRRSLDHAVAERYSVLLEGTFRNPLMVVQTAERFHQEGYQVEVVGLAVPERTSLLSTVDRYLEAPEHAARWTPARAHSISYRMVPATLQAMEDSPHIQRLSVTNRAGENLFTNIRTSTGMWKDPTPGGAVVATKVERDTLLSPEAANAWLKGYVASTRELAIRGQLNEVTRPTVERLGQIADQVATVAFPHDVQARAMLTKYSTRLQQAPDTAMDLRDAELDSRFDGWTDEGRTSGETHQQSGRGALGQDPDPALAERVVVNDLLAQRGDRMASRFDMLLAGMGDEETTAAIAAWEALGKPETTREREIRLLAEQTTLEATAKAQQEVKAPELSEKTQSSFHGLGETSERLQGTDTETMKRTASAIWETPKPSMMSLVAHRTEWALYDDLHGYGRRPRTLAVKMPSKAPGSYGALLHPSTGAAYERDRRQAKQGDQEYSG